MLHWVKTASQAQSGCKLNIQQQNKSHFVSKPQPQRTPNVTQGDHVPFKQLGGGTEGPQLGLGLCYDSVGQDIYIL